MPNTVGILHVKIRYRSKFHSKAQGLSPMVQKPLMFATLSLICSKIATQGPQVSPLHGGGDIHLAYRSVENLISHSPKHLFIPHQITPLSVGVHLSQDQTREDTRLVSTPQWTPMQITGGHPYIHYPLHGHSGKRRAVL